MRPHPEETRLQSLLLLKGLERKYGKGRTDNPNSKLRREAGNPLNLQAQPTEMSTIDERAEYRMMQNGYWRWWSAGRSRKS